VSLEQSIHEITGIPYRALRGGDLSSFSTLERLTWTEHRRTKRREDKAYCLLGIFGVYMPLVYGEGDHAWSRSMEKIDKKHTEKEEAEHILSFLPIATDAPFNALVHQFEPICLQQTRTELLDDIAQWIDGHDTPCVFWLNGMAGTGKSTVARTVARTCHEKGMLGPASSFQEEAEISLMQPSS
jgi:hypothetical protein